MTDSKGKHSPDVENNAGAVRSGQANPAGTLYVVATPIGNLGDMTPRAVETLAQVDLVATEDTRRSGQLLAHFSINTAMTAYHDHSDSRAATSLVKKLSAGQSIALVSDAGTPLISDPGYQLVRQASELGIQVVSIPGACALVAALSIAGMPTDRFVFEGFLPAKTEARKKRLQALAKEPRTLVFYEAPHRLLASLEDMAKVLGSGRELAVTRELTKRYETVVAGTLENVIGRVQADQNQQRGEIVIVVKGAVEPAAGEGDSQQEADRVLTILLREMSVKQAAAMAAELTGLKKNYLYNRALTLTDTGEQN